MFIECDELTNIIENWTFCYGADVGDIDIATVLAISPPSTSSSASSRSQEIDVTVPKMVPKKLRPGSLRCIAMYRLQGKVESKNSSYTDCRAIRSCSSFAFTVQAPQAESDVANSTQKNDRQELYPSGVLRITLRDHSL